ncbi:hypothetical protein EO95_17665 [Methanosarcina sp. 1.H.T.1A.1]|jgi:hypothetical protein|uniref:hypothetical protein n=1 Tax=unclassified Methanosarcina TaxID=2644672 RepID=UPI0006220581|nr:MULTISPECIES: hypothetical protein [unclassified Methanosarcina]KKG09184.1 hypothetical protein EO92_00955 [Methanosarcina sp. 2.H.A.1B.4]KKH47683.1 hypothetical protein EO93_13045 [Methanosarcina sp. 1.H.A.2.2]KKH95970.1 hypothetical protein EO95_17665 [Methanosarcina sp. 1.H.T.1A.1]
MCAQKTQDLEAKISSPQPLGSFEMGRNDVNVVCTYGKIAVWFGRKVPDYIIAQVLIGISKVDPSTVHEFEIICDFDEITEYESKGYILVSYGKTAGGYRVNYSIPFSNKKALFHLSRFVLEELHKGEVRKDFYWNGSDCDIQRLYKEFKNNIDNWELKAINYKTEPQTNR